MSCPIGYGTRTGYYRGCRCHDCVLAEKRYQLARANGETGHFVDVVPTLRLLRDLKRRGWSVSEIAAETGVERSALYYILRKNRSVRSSTAEAIASFAARVTDPARRVHLDADALRHRIGCNPEAYGEAFARAYFRAMAGHRVQLDTAERIAGVLCVHPSELIAEEVPTCA